VLAQHALYGGRRDAVAFGDLSKALALAAVSLDSSIIEFEGIVADVTAFESGSPHACAYPLDDQAAFEFSDGADDDHDSAAQRSGSVDAFPEADELDLESAELVKHCEEVTGRTRDAVTRPDQHDIEAAGVGLFAIISSGRGEYSILDLRAVLEGVLAERRGCVVIANRNEDTIESALPAYRAHLSRNYSWNSQLDVRSISSGGEIVAMMQAAEPWHRDDLAICTMICFCFTTGRRSLRQCKMRSILVVVANIIAHEAFQMPLIQDDHMVEQITAAVSDKTFGNAVLPWTAEAGSLGPDAKYLHRVDHFFIELRSAIKD